MANRTPKLSPAAALRIFCLIGALVASSSWATVVTWQPGQNPSAPTFEPSHAGTAPSASVPNFANIMSQVSFRSAPQSGATNETGSFRAAAFSEKLPAHDFGFQGVAPAILGVQARAVGAFDARFAAVPNYLTISKGMTNAPGRTTSSAGGPVPVPEMSAFFPIVGLVVAVFCTKILRRRKATQISTYRRSV